MRNKFPREKPPSFRRCYNNEKVGDAIKKLSPEVLKDSTKADQAFQKIFKEHGLDWKKLDKSDKEKLRELTKRLASGYLDKRLFNKYLDEVDRLALNRELSSKQRKLLQSNIEGNRYSYLGPEKAAQTRVLQISEAASR